MAPLNVAFHCHSKWSYDATWELADIAAYFGARGADAVMMTEHDTGFARDDFAAYRAACAAASTRECTLIPGIEYSSPDNDIHILTWGLDHFLAEHRDVSETLARVADAGGAAIFAHPVRRDAWAKFDPDWIPYLSAIEIWNRKSDGLAPGRRALELWRQTGLAASVGCDFHLPRHYYPIRNRICPDPGAPDLEAGLVAQIRAGRITPMAFAGALLDAQGQLAPVWHHRGADAARRTILELGRSTGLIKRRQKSGSRK